MRRRMMTKLTPAVFAMVLLGAAAARAQDPEPVTVRAHRLTQPLVVDGRLDEAIYAATGRRLHSGSRSRTTASRPPSKPRCGCSSTTRTSTSRRACWTASRSAMVANEMRRDSNSIYPERELRRRPRHVPRSPQRRSIFQTNPLGAHARRPVVDEGTANDDWNTVWDVQTGAIRGRLDRRDGDSVQVAALSGRAPQIWGINVRRIVKWKNEISYLTRGARVAAASSGVYQMSRRRRRWSASKRRRSRRTWS